MRVKVLGGGWYGCSIAAGLLARGVDVELHECAERLFAGASGSNPARLHQGQHYPRSKLTRAFCQEHHAAFMERYGHLTRSVPINLYAVASDDSYLDFGTYTQVLKNEIEFITVYDPSEFGLQNVEGAILTGERHIVIREAREYFTGLLGKRVRFNRPAFPTPEVREWDWIIDCTFCARDSYNIDRYEACVTYLLEGAGQDFRAVTVMDGPFPSLYPWDEPYGLSSLTSAKLTPIKRCETWQEAQDVLKATSSAALVERGEEMLEQMAHYWPLAQDAYSVVGWRLAVRAMPKSAADARLVDIVQIGDSCLRVRAGKIDAVIHAEQQVATIIGCTPNT